METKEIIRRIDFALDKGRLALNHRIRSSMMADHVQTGYYAGFRSASLSLISAVYGESHSYYQEFERQVNNSYVTNVDAGISILEVIKEEIEQGWFTGLKRLVSAEIFSDFLEMARHLLDANYKDPAAVVIGSVLEEHLRQLSVSNGLDITFVKGEEIVPKKANQINTDLAKAAVYNVLEQKNVTAWLDLRNKAAHGKYSEYSQELVEIMYLGVSNFVAIR